MKIKINKKPLEFKWRILLGFLISLCIVLSTFAVTTAFFINVKMAEIDKHVSPGTWIAKYEMYGMYDIHNDIYTITFLNVENKSFYLTSTSNKSNSMSPWSSPDCVLLVMKPNTTDLKNLKAGDIIVFNQDDKLIVHRIIHVNEDDTFTTKGDNNIVVDDLVHYDDIVGIVVGVFY